MERFEKNIDTIKKTSKEISIWLKKNTILFPQKKLEKKSLMEKDGVENYCELGNIEALSKMMMNLKLEIKLGQLLKICPQLILIMDKYLLKMKEPQVTNVCKITTIKIKDFDEALLVVQVRIGKFGVQNVLLDGRCGVNIILKSLRKKVGLRISQPIPFVVIMVEQRKVQPLGLIRNLKINLGSCVYKILVTTLNMEMGIEAYSMFMGRLWLKQTKAHCN